MELTRRQTLIGGGVAAATIGGYLVLSDRFSDVDEPVSAYRDAPWSAYRGDPARTGIRTGDAGPGESLEVSWELETGDLLAAETDTSDQVSGITTSWPIVSENHVYLTAVYREPDGHTYATHLLAAKPDTGEAAWSQPINDGLEYPDLFYGPVLADGTIYVADYTDTGSIHRVAAETGDAHTPLDLDVDGLGQPLVINGKILFVASQDGEISLRAIDAESGETDWTVSTAGSVTQLPTLSVAGDRLVQEQSVNDPTVATRVLEDGSTITNESITFDADIEHPQLIDLSVPVLTGETAYLAGGSNALESMDESPLLAIDTDSGEEAWQYYPPEIERTVTTAENGDIVEESEEFAALYGPPLVADGMIYVSGYGEHDGDTDEPALFAIDADSRELEWAQQIERGTYAPVMSGDVIYCPGTSEIRAISTGGESLDTVAIDSRIQVGWSPALGRGRLFVPTATGIVALE